VLDLKIDQLHLAFETAAGHEQRVRPIVGRALELLAERLDERMVRAGSARLDALDLPPQRLDLATMSDEQAAQLLAAGLAEALALKLHF
jgi:hypothetical protein